MCVHACVRACVTSSQTPRTSNGEALLCTILPGEPVLSGHGMCVWADSADVTDI